MRIYSVFAPWQTIIRAVANHHPQVQDTVSVIGKQVKNLDADGKLFFSINFKKGLGSNLNKRHY